MKQEMQWLIEQRLDGDDLKRLASLADKLALTMPAIYVTLVSMMTRALKQFVTML